MAFNLLRQKNIFDQFGNLQSDYQDDSSSDDSSPDDYSAAPDDQTPQIPGWAPPDTSDEYGGNPPEDMGGGISKIVKTPKIPDYSATANQPPPVNEQDRMMQIYDKLYKPEHTATDRLNELLNQAPNADDYKPGMLRLIGALGTSMGKGGLKAGEDILDSPYKDAISEWKDKTAPFQAGATLENNANINARQVASSTASSIATAEKNAETQRANQAKEEVAKMRATAYAYKNEGYTITKEGSRIMATDPHTLERVDLGPSGMMDQADEISLTSKGKVAAATASGAAAVERQNAAGTGIFEDRSTGARYRVDPNDPTKLIPMTGGPAGPLDKPGTDRPPAPEKPGDVPKDIQNKLETTYHTDPEGEKWIDYNETTGKYSMKQKPVPSNGYFGSSFGAVPQSDLDEWNRVNTKVYGTGSSTTNSSSSNNGTAKSTRINPNTGQLMLPQAQGGRGDINLPKDTTTGSLTYDQQMAEVNKGNRVIAVDPNGVQHTILNNQASIQEAISKHWKVQVK